MSGWLLYLVVGFALVMPATAQSDALLGEFQASFGVTIATIMFIGQQAIALSGALIGPLMGISSVLWLVMRNDIAIEPRTSWV